MWIWVSSMDPSMLVLWHLASQLPARALVLLDVCNQTIAERAAKSVHYHGRQARYIVDA